MINNQKNIQEEETRKTTWRRLLAQGEGGHVLGLGTAQAALSAALSGTLPQKWVILAKSGEKKATLIIYEKYAPPM